MSPKKENHTDIDEEEREIKNISDTVISEIVLSEKLKLSQEKRKKLREGII